MNRSSDDISHQNRFESVTFDTWGKTDIGRVRDVNQDQFFVGTRQSSIRATSASFSQQSAMNYFGQKQGEIMIVADGMGGHAAGERASQIAVEHLAQRLASFTSAPSPSLTSDQGGESTTLLRALLEETHDRILKEAEKNPDQRGMGTTLTMAEISWPQLSVLHAGDSRCYLIRDGIASCLTTDHTLARKMVDAGDMKPEDEAESRWSNVLWNVLGGQLEGSLIAQVTQIDLLPGDSVVLCSDGLHRYVNNELLALTVAEGEDSQSICEELIRLANEAGGEDNITVIVSQIRRGRKRSSGQTTVIDETMTEEGFESDETDDSLATLKEFDTTVDEKFVE